MAEVWKNSSKKVSNATNIKLVRFMAYFFQGIHRSERESFTMMHLSGTHSGKSTGEMRIVSCSRTHAEDLSRTSISCNK